MKFFVGVFLSLVVFNAFAESERDLVLEVKVKEVMTAFRDKKDQPTKNHAINEFIKSLKPLCKVVANVKWGEVPESELKKLDKAVGVFIGGMSDFQIKLNADENAKLTSGDRTEIKRICREIEKHSMN